MAALTVCGALAQPAAAQSTGSIHAADALRTVNRAIERQLAWASNAVPAAVHIESFVVDDVDATLTPDTPAGLRWGPLRRPGAIGGRSMAPAFGGAGLYAHVDLAPALPARWHSAVGRPDGGVTVELRPASSPLSGLALGSMLRWQLRDGGQMALRLRGGRLSLQYGLNFSI